MKNILPIFLLLFLFSCNEKENQSEPVINSTSEAGWTKPMIYIVDGATTYYDDVEDEDFSDYSKLVSEIFEQVYAGKLQAYDFIEGTPLSPEEVKKRSLQIDTVIIRNPNPDLDNETKIIKTENDKNIYSVKIKETWHFNKENLQLEKKVIALAPRSPVYSSDGSEIKGYKPLFWVFFDKEAEKAFIRKNP